MSRYIGDTDPDPVLAAAAHWRDSALLGEGSVFSSEALWTADGLEALDRFFVQRPDIGEGKYLQKLEKQLEPSDAKAKMLAAEIVWLMYLCPSSLTPNHKRQTVKTIWSWSGEQFPEATPWTDDRVLFGIGSAGPGFNQNQWRELTFCINFVRTFRALTPEDQKRLLDDAWAFDEWLKRVPDWEARQFRHMLLFLLFPDEFERIFGKIDRRAIARQFSAKDRREINRMDPLQLDKELRDIRFRLESERGTSNLDFYLPPLKGEWNSESFATATEDVTSEHVREALSEIDSQGIPPDADSTGYDLAHLGKRYPPKLVLALAVKNATGEALDRSEFSGGEESSAFRLLRKLGFEIVTKTEEKKVIEELLRRFLAQAQAGNRLAVQGYLIEYRGLRVKVSFGQGNSAKIPWIAFLSRGQSVSDGIYPVFLYYKDENLLLLCYGLSETNQPAFSWGDLEYPSVHNWFRGHGLRNPNRYGASFVRLDCDTTRELPFREIEVALDEMIDRYEDALKGGSPTDANAIAVDKLKLPVQVDLARAATAFASALHASSVRFGSQHETLVRSFLSSIVTKPLVIVTGLSGSGKTQIAIRLGEWLGEARLYVAAVRPDWTGAEALFGYEDGLKPAVAGRAAWSVPPALEFMLRAASDPQHPYLILLDEMNLAHVERYFADVLSGMESEQPCLPNIRRGQDGLWRIPVDGRDLLPFPRNVWVVGTVNIDETTYMFSPKVLDRANTFEFRVDAGDLLAVAKKPSACIPGSPELVRGLLRISQDDKWHLSNPASFQDDLDGRLRQLHLLLSRYGLEFGHRVFYEAIRFAAISESAGMEGLDAVLDRIVMQKVLPRLHGSRRRLELPLLSLAEYCRDLPETSSSDEKLPTLNVEQVSTVGPRLPSSHAKLVRMLHNLRANQFASFTE